MIIGVREHKKVGWNQVDEAGLQYLESVDQSIKLVGLTNEAFCSFLKRAVQSEFPYLVINTCFNPDEIEGFEAKKNIEVIEKSVTKAYLKEIIASCAEEIIKSEIPILIENGISGNDLSGYYYNDFSDTRRIKDIVEYADALCGKGLFSICVNTGYINLLSQSARKIIEGAGSSLQLIHINDNDGFHNDMQMPYTFTMGRGMQTTDWKQIIGSLIRVGFDGIMIFDTEGLFNRTPDKLIVSMLRMLLSIALFWNRIIHFDEVLGADKKIILFGAGRMASNYLHIWEDRFPPAFLVDNNSSRWGSEHRGYEIKNPEAIYDIPAENRLVLICNAHYEEIGFQLRKMGIDYIDYDDNYYDFVM